MSISVEQVKHIALLSRLELSNDEVNKFARELNEILSYAQQITELDTSDVPLTSHAISLKNVLREDEVRSSLSNEDAIGNAPDPEAPYFRVPRVID